MLHDATVQMKDLKRQQLELQEEIKIKENTIYIGNVLTYQGFKFAKTGANLLLLLLSLF